MLTKQWVAHLSYIVFVLFCFLFRQLSGSESTMHSHISGLSLRSCISLFLCTLILFFFYLPTILPLMVACPFGQIYDSRKPWRPRLQRRFVFLSPFRIYTSYPPSQNWFFQEFHLLLLMQRPLTPQMYRKNFYLLFAASQNSSFGKQACSLFLLSMSWASYPSSTSPWSGVSWSSISLSSRLLRCGRPSRGWSRQRLSLGPRLSKRSDEWAEFASCLARLFPSAPSFHFTLCAAASSPISPLWT